MEIRFRSALLRRCYEKHAVGTRRWNQEIARAYIRRVNLLAACSSSGDIPRLPPIRFHELKGEMQGKCALDLIGRWRLIVMVDEVKGEVCIEEVSNHYGD